MEEVIVNELIKKNYKSLHIDTDVEQLNLLMIDLMKDIEKSHLSGFKKKKK